MLVVWERRQARIVGRIVVSEYQRAIPALIVELVSETVETLLPDSFKLLKDAEARSIVETYLTVEKCSDCCDGDL